MTADYQLALDAHERGDLDGMIAYARETVAHDPDHAGGWHVLGGGLLSRGDDAEARAALSKAERIYREQAIADPTNVEPHYQLACVHALRGDEQGAVGHLRAAFALDDSLYACLTRERANEDPDFETMLRGRDLDVLVPRVTPAAEYARQLEYFHARNVVFTVVSSFSVSGVEAISQDFRLPASRQAEALARFQRGPVAAPERSTWVSEGGDAKERRDRAWALTVTTEREAQRRKEATTLDAIFNGLFMSLTRDSAGDIVDITGQGGGVWAGSELAEIADLVQDGSWFLYLVWGGGYLRLRVSDGRVHYERGDWPR